MTAAVVPLPVETPTGQPAQPAPPRSVYLDAYLAPLRPWLDRESVTEILVNRPGEIWVEDAAHPGMQRIDLPLSTLCYVAGTSTANWLNADDFCFANFRASLCTLTQWRLAVCRAGASTPGRTWTATPSGSASHPRRRLP